MSSRFRLLIVSLAILGFAFASSSAWVHYKAMTDASYISPCDFNATFNCSEVYLSQYGSMAGVPVALGGMFWFGLVGLIALYSKPGKGTSAGGVYIFALSTIGLAVILYLAYASFVVLETACVLCLGTYVAVIGIFIVSAFASSMPMTALPGRLFGDIAAAFRDSSAGVLALVLALGTTYAAIYVFPKEGAIPQAETAPPSATAATDFAGAWARLPRVDLGIPADGAKVVVVKFNDYQCGGCRVTHEWYKPILAKFQQSHPGAVKYVLKDWPWNGKCNFYSGAGAPNHPGACEAAAAARMARDRGPAKEAEMEDWLYANQATLSPETVSAAAERILGVKNFSSEYAEKLKGIRQDVADGGALRVNTTPTLFINGVRVDRELMPARDFELAIQLELDKAAGK